MRIAIACDKEQVADHFGDCGWFLLHDTKEKKADKVSRRMLDNPRHTRGFLPDYLQAEKVDVVIAGNMGKKAVARFQEKGIRVVIGAKGDPETVLAAFLSGNLETEATPCEGHAHRDNCGKQKETG